MVKVRSMERPDGHHAEVLAGRGGTAETASPRPPALLRRTDHASAASAVPVLFTVDVEPDDAWANHQNESVRNVRELERFQELLDRYGARATLLVTYRVVQSDEMVELLRKLAFRHGAEVGAHLHPWETPPFMKSNLDARYPSFPHELPVSLFEEKLTTLTEAIAARIGPPTSYRAGRWGFSAEHIPALERLGYEVDTSVTPWIDWRVTIGIPTDDQGRGGPDFRFAPRNAYRPAYTDVTRHGNASLVEVPVTVSFTRPTPPWIQDWYGRLPLLVRRLLRKAEILRPVWAMPAEQTEERLAAMMDSLWRQSPSHINVALHSSELMENGSPSSRTRQAVDGMFRRLEAILCRAAGSRAGVFATLTAAARQWRLFRTPGAPPETVPD